MKKKIFKRVLCALTVCCQLILAGGVVVYAQDNEPSYAVVSPTSIGGREPVNS